VIVMPFAAAMAKKNRLTYQDVDRPRIGAFPVDHHDGAALESPHPLGALLAITGVERGDVYPARQRSVNRVGPLELPLDTKRVREQRLGRERGAVELDCLPLALDGVTGRGGHAVPQHEVARLDAELRGVRDQLLAPDAYGHVVLLADHRCAGQPVSDLVGLAEPLAERVDVRKCAAVEGGHGGGS
jgi:hypothetical protein